MVINHKRTERLYYGLGLQLKNRKPKRRIYKPENPLPPPEHSNVRWSMDFVHDNLADGRSFRTLTIIDEFSRECPAMEVDLSLSGLRVVRVLEKLSKTRGLPQEIGVDHGTEFTSKALTTLTLQHGVRLPYASPGDKNENAFIESFNGKLRDECLNMHWFSRLANAREIIEAWRVDYNEVRPHRSLKGFSPVQYRKSKELKLAA